MRPELLVDAVPIVREAESQSAMHFYALISGGEDSITAADVASRIPPILGRVLAVHVEWDSARKRFERRRDAAM